MILHESIALFLQIQCLPFNNTQEQISHKKKASLALPFAAIFE